MISPVDSRLDKVDITWFVPGGLSGDVPLKWVSKSASWYNDDPFSAKTGINMDHIFKIF